MRLSIRKAALSDTVDLAEILTQAMQYKLSLGDKAWGEHPYTAEQVQEQIVKGNTYVAWINDKRVGTLILLWEDEMYWGKQPPEAAYVHKLAIRDVYHGQGIGEKLLDWADQQAGEQRRKLLRIDFPPTNAGLRAYYEKLGFRWVMDREIHAPHATYIAALYERPVNL